MSELNDFLQLIAEAKKEKKAHVEEVKVGMTDFFEAVAQAKAEDPKHQLIKKVKENVKQDISSLFEQLASAKQVPVEKIEEIVETVELIESVEEPQPIVEEVIIEPIVEKTEVEKLAAALPKDSFQQPEVPKVAPEIKVITDKLKFLEQWVGKISAAGPGSGEVNLRWLDDVDRSSIYDGRYLRYDDHTKKFVFDEVNTVSIVYDTQVVTGPTYIAAEDDYYIGVNYAGPVTITLHPTPVSGQSYVVKDESGHCSTNPITIKSDTDTIDNDPDGIVLQIDNGGIHFIYRDGWRIV